MDAFLNFFIQNLASIIQWIVAIVLLLLGSMFVLMILNKGKRNEDSDFQIGDLGSLEATLKEIVKSGTIAAHSATSGASVGAGDGNLPSIENMMQELAQREAEIQILKKGQEASGGKVGGGGNPEMELTSYLEKIRDLEGKLSEYEIIEDDIADLSLFKEENARLKQQLEALSSGGIGSAEPTISTSTEPAAIDENIVEAAPAIAAEPAATDVKEKGEDLVAEFAAAVDQHDLDEPAAEPNPLDDILTESSIELTADLEILNQSLAEMEGNPADALPAEDKPKIGNSPVFDPPSDGPQDDILAEFTKSLGAMDQPPAGEKSGSKARGFAEEAVEAGAAVEPPKTKAPVDTDKMLEEIAGLENLAASADGESALDGEVDTDKMAAEANKLLSNE